MNVGALRSVHCGRKMTVGSISGVIWAAGSRLRYPRGSLLNPRPPIDVHVQLIQDGRMRHYVFAPSVDVKLSYAALPKLNLVDEGVI